MHISNQIADAAKNAAKPIVLIGAEAVTHIRRRVILSYCNRFDTGFLWEHLIGAEGIQDSAGWLRLKSLNVTAPVILFFNPEDDPAGFEFKSLPDVPAVLGECFGFEFYLTDREKSFVISFNHHDMLIGAGKAAEWIRQMKGNETGNHTGPESCGGSTSRDNL
ncbi:MAG: hypothetical protein JWN24_2934 [Phycisphaerales bacterium]|nr:hypothetical protein [Phycisphaerales bacterium]